MAQSLNVKAFPAYQLWERCAKKFPAPHSFYPLNMIFYPALPCTLRLPATDSAPGLRTPGSVLQTQYSRLTSPSTS